VTRLVNTCNPCAALNCWVHNICHIISNTITLDLQVIIFCLVLEPYTAPQPNINTHAM